MNSIIRLAGPLVRRCEGGKQCIRLLRLPVVRSRRASRGRRGCCQWELASAAGGPRGPKPALRPAHKSTRVAGESRRGGGSAGSADMRRGEEGNWRVIAGSGSAVRLREFESGWQYVQLQLPVAAGPGPGGQKRRKCVCLFVAPNGEVCFVFAKREGGLSARQRKKTRQMGKIDK